MSPVTTGVVAKTIEGKRTYKIGKEGKKQEVPFKYQVITGEPTFDELCEYLLANGYSKELPDGATINAKGSVSMSTDDADTADDTDEADNEPGKRGKEETPDSLVGALLYFFKQRNSQRAGAKVLSDALNTPERQFSNAESELEKIMLHGKATELDKQKAALTIKLMRATTAEEKETVLKELAAILG